MCFKINKFNLFDIIIKQFKMTQVQEESKKYQWKKGDNFGDIVEVASEDDKFVNFTNGQRIFKTVLSEFLDPVIDGMVPFPQPNAITPQQTQQPVKAEVKEEVKVEPAKKEPSIMGSMILKMSKKNVVNVPIQININIPTPQLYGMLGEGMEEEDLNEEISQVALSQIEMEKLQQYVKNSVSEFLSEYYS